MAVFYPTGAVWNWDVYTEGTSIIVEPTHGGASSIAGFTFNSAQTAGNVVKLATGTVVDTPATDDAATIGVVTQTTASGAHGPVCIRGVVKNVTASGAITVGQRVHAAAAPVGSVYYHSTPVSYETIGIAITASTTTGNTIVLYVCP